MPTFTQALLWLFVIDLGIASGAGSGSADTARLKRRNPMSVYQSSPSPWPDRMLAILRIVAGLVFISAGTMKLFGFPHSPVQMPPFTLLSEIGIAGILETFGGLLIVLGLLTRPVAF